MFNSPWQKPFRGTLVNKGHPLARGLAGCWIFNEGTGEKVFDLSGNGNHGVLTNMDPTTDWVAGRVGHALDFDGVNDHIIVSDSPTLTPANSISFGLWLKRANTNAGREVWCGKGSGVSYPTTSYWLEDWDGSGTIRTLISCDSGYTQTIHSDLVVSDTDWHFAVCTWDGSTVRAYLDGGISSTTGSRGGNLVDTTDAFAIGRLGTYNGLYFEGRIGKVPMYNRALTAEEVEWLYRETLAMFQQPSRAKYFLPITGYTLACEAGSYAAAGQTAGTLKDSKIVVDADSFTITGQVASLEHDKKVVAEGGSFTLTGQLASLEYGRKITSEAGTLAITGQDVTLIYSGAGYIITAEGGTYVLTGQAASLLRAAKIAADAGSLGLVGQAATLLKTSRIVATPASYSITGTAANLEKDSVLAIGSGSFAITGQDVVLTYSGGYILAIEGGIYMLSGQEAALRRTIRTKLAGIDVVDGKFSFIQGVQIVER